MTRVSDEESGRDRKVAPHFFACAAFLLLPLFATHALSEPYVPDSDALVLERVPAALATRQLEPLRRQLSAEPRDLQSALELAQGYLEIGRETSDPRFVSYAQATLTPWLEQENPPAPVLVMAATALQSSHRFDESLALLDRALAGDPQNAQAWLTKATVLQVQGNLSAARAACRQLLQTASQLIALTCVTSVDGLNGQLESSYRALQRVFARDSGAEEDIRSWVLGHLGEMAVRLGNFDTAEEHFKAALRATPGDVYLKGAYADLLLLQNRDREVVELLDGSESQDVLLLRLAIAGQRIGTDEGARWERLFDARLRAARPDDDTHLREHARFMLEVSGDAARALELAQKNWQVQREPADLHVYMNSAHRAKKPQAAEALHEWVRQTGYEDRTLEIASMTAIHQPQ